MKGMHTDTRQTIPASQYQPSGAVIYHCEHHEYHYTGFQGRLCNCRTGHMSPLLGWKVQLGNQTFNQDTNRIKKGETECHGSKEKPEPWTGHWVAVCFNEAVGKESG